MYLVSMWSLYRHVHVVSFLKGGGGLIQKMLTSKKQNKTKTKKNPIPSISLLISLFSLPILYAPPPLLPQQVGEHHYNSIFLYVNLIKMSAAPPPRLMLRAC